MVKITERLQTKYKKSHDALITLKEAIENMKSVDKIAELIKEYPEKIYKIYRDSLIQRFEYTFDQTWKLLCAYLESEGHKIDIQTPKSTFRECLKNNMLSEQEVRLAIQMVDHRNLTTHDYDEPLIEKITENIPSYCDLLEKIVQRAKVKT
jgi:nucleotidyltransferase substrate binding protein (TIGR01987 family)